MTLLTPPMTSFTQPMTSFTDTMTSFTQLTPLIVITFGRPKVITMRTVLPRTWCTQASYHVHTPWGAALDGSISHPKCGLLFTEAPFNSHRP